MKKVLSFICIPLLLIACNGGPDDGYATDGHDHGGTLGGHEHAAQEPLTHTAYTDSIELFVEFMPLVVGQEADFATHLTRLGAVFTPLGTGSATVGFIGPMAGEEARADAPTSPGMFHLAFTPHKAGTGQLQFTVTTGGRTDRIILDSVTVYADPHAAAHAVARPRPVGDITYLKQQAWRIPFATEVVEKRPFAASVHVGAEVEPAITSEEVITARSAGVVHIRGDAALEGMTVRAGQALFELSSQGMAEGNAGAALEQARNDRDRAKADLERIEGLYADRLATQEDVLRARNTFANADALVKQTGSALTVSSGINGYVRSLRVREGEFVQPGAVLATVARNDRLSIHVDVPVQAFGKLGTVTDARIKAQDGKVFTLRELNGSVVSTGRAADGFYIPVRLAADGNNALLPGSMAEVWLLGEDRQEAISIPLSAMLEQEGRFYCYVQTAGETMDKRWLTLGANDGLRTQVLAGLRPGERVVTTGAMDVKLATMGGALPAHGHEH